MGRNKLFREAFGHKNWAEEKEKETYALVLRGE